MASWTGIIYLTTNTINGKIYVGQTYSTKSTYMGSGVFIKKAIKKYGKQNFNRVILVDNIELVDQLNCLEMFYIKLYNACDPKIGYNISLGGTNKGFKHTKETIEKIKQRSLQQDNLDRIRNIQKIASKNRIGQHCSKQRKINMMVTKFGKLQEIEIYNLTQNLLYTCNFSTEASNLTGVKPSAIRNNLSNLSKSSGGFVFKYKNIL